jgi:hypothetical protein
VPQYLIMAFSLAFDAPAEKASRVSFSATAVHGTAAASSSALPDENLWLRSIKLASPKSDVLAHYGQRIFVTSSGRYYVPAQSDREEILALRRNGDVAGRVLAAATQTLNTELERQSGLEPTRGALLIAHLAGTELAIRYLRALGTLPDAKALSAVPGLAELLEGSVGVTLAQLDHRLNKALQARAHQIAAASPDSKADKLKGTLTRPDAHTPAEAKFAAR